MSKRLGGKLDTSETEDPYYIRVEFAERNIFHLWKTFSKTSIIRGVYICVCSELEWILSPHEY